MADKNPIQIIAEKIAYWDYTTATGEEPDSDESLVLPPHIEIASRVIEALVAAGHMPAQEA